MDFRGENCFVTDRAVSGYGKAGLPPLMPAPAHPGGSVGYGVLTSVDMFLSFLET